MSRVSNEEMPSVQFCQNGMTVRVVQDGAEGDLRLVIEDRSEHEASFACHLDDLLAPLHGMAYQTGSGNGHVLISPSGQHVRVSFGLAGDGNEWCEIAKDLYERSLLTLKSGRSDSVL